MKRRGFLKSTATTPVVIATPHIFLFKTIKPYFGKPIPKFVNFGIPYSGNPIPKFELGGIIPLTEGEMILPDGEMIVSNDVAEQIKKDIYFHNGKLTFDIKGEKLWTIDRLKSKIK